MTDTAKPGLLIFYDYFYPAYKAGGPIQSLTNLVLALKDEYNISVITSNHDLNEVTSLTGIETNDWSKIQLPGSGSFINIWYAGTAEPTTATIKKIIRQTSPSAVYLNGMFSYRFVLLPLIAIKGLKIILCPRGMLQVGALAGKPVKKKIYLSILKMSGLIKKITWHATNEDEEADITREFGIHSRIIVAGNIPRKPVLNMAYPGKQPGKLRLVYLSLISEKKNLLQLIYIISKLKDGISLDIYGPVKDPAYWQKCMEAIKSVPGKITYKGDIVPEKVQQVFSEYDASILLTRGENFGHALYESLSTGRPVITSHFTAWNQLADKKAGWNVNISDDEEIIKLINHISAIGQIEYNEYCNGAYHLAYQYYKTGFNIDSYRKLFS